MRNYFLTLFIFLFSYSFGQLTGIQSLTTAQEEVESEAKWAQESFAQYNQSLEDISLRDQNAKHFRNSDGTYTAIIAAGNLHYWENNKWNTIFHAIEPTSNGYQNITNSHKTFFPNVSNGFIRTILPSGETMKDMVGMRMFFETNGQEENAIQILSKPGSVYYNELTYSGVYGNGIDLRLTQNTTKRKLDYIISNLTDIGSIPIGAEYLVFEEKVELPSGWTATLENNQILIKDANQNIKAVYEKPIYKDAPQLDLDGHYHSDEIHGIYSISQSGINLTIKTKVQLTWLTAADRTFPVQIDPTINLYPNNADWWTGHIHTNGSSPSPYTTTTITAGNNDNMRVGKGTNGSENNNCYHSWAKFNIASISSLCVNSVNVNVTPYDNDGVIGSGCFINVSLRPLANDPVAATNANRLTDIRDGSIYNNIVFNTGNESGLQSFALGATGLTDLINSVSSGWFGVGFNSTAVQSSHYDYLWFRPHSHASKPYLSVVYAAANAGSDVSVCNGSSIVLNGSTTDASSNSTASGSATFNYSGSGWDYTGFGIGGTTSGMPANAVITSVSVTGSTGVSCSWTSMDFYVNNSYIDWYCNGTWAYNGLNGSPANGQIFRIYAYDEDWWDDYVTLTMSVTVNYTYTVSNPSVLSWTGGPIVSGGTTLTPTVNPSATTTYTLTSTSNGCSVSDQVIVTVNQPSVAPTAITGTTATCSGSSTTLTLSGGTAGTGATAQWFAGSCGSAVIGTGNSIIVSPGSTTTYYVRYTGPCNTTTCASVTVTVNSASTSPTISPIAGTICPNTNVTLTAGGGTAGAGSTINWYSGPNGTGTYLGTGNSIVVAPSVTTTYYARREGTCNTTADASVTVQVKTYVYALNGTSTSNYCTDNSGWHHFYNGNEIIFSVQGNLSAVPPGYPVATIYDNNAYYQTSGTPTSTLCAAGYNPGEEKFEMERSWNLDFGGGTPVGNYNIRFYYQPSERTAIENAAIAFMSANPECGYTYKYPTPLGFYWFKNTGSNYLAPEFDGTHYTGTTAVTPTGVNYAQWMSIPSFSGGSGAVILVPDPLLTAFLPVELSAFTAICDENSGSVKVKWNTNSEHNSSHFVVERSFDGVYWKEVGNKTAAGNSTTLVNYELIDSEVNGYGLIYYRLNQYDLNGDLKQYGPTSAQCNLDENNFELFPNPAGTTVNILLKGDFDLANTRLEFHDMNGKLVKQANYSEQTGKLLTLDIENLEPGVYLVRLFDGISNGNFIKFIKQ